MTDQDGPLWTIHIPGGGIKKVHLPPLPGEEAPLYVFGPITTQVIDEGGAVFTFETVLNEAKIYGVNELDWFKLYQPEGERT